MNKVGLFTLYPSRLYLRGPRNVGKKGARAAAEWDEVTACVNACQLGTVTPTDRPRAGWQRSRWPAMSDEDLATFKQSAKWFAQGVRGRLQAQRVGKASG